LDRARAADLIERVETSIRAAGPQTTCERLGRKAEQCVGQVVVGGAEVRMVEEVEELAPEEEVHSLGESKSPLNGKVGLDTEAAQHIAPKIALLFGRCRCERCLVENLAAGPGQISFDGCP
jgi:hypothetical protein